MSAVRLPAKIEHLESLIKAVSDFAAKHGFGGKRIREMELATEEAVVNIMHYAYPEGRPGEVEVQCRMVNDARLIVEIRDWGAPFDIRSVSGPAVEAPLSDRPIGGLGIHLIRKVTDEIDYHPGREGNTLMLIFNR